MSAGVAAKKSPVAFQKKKKMLNIVKLFNRCIIVSGNEENVVKAMNLHDK